LNPDFLYRIRGLGKIFPDGTEALRHIDLDLFPSQFVIIAGSNGSGKTVLMRLLVGLMEPSRGTILYQGQDIRKRTALIRRSVGLVFQDPDAQIVGETVEEDTAFGPRNLDLPESEVDQRVREALTAVGLGEKKDSSPRGLSGGEKGGSRWPASSPWAVGRDSGRTLREPRLAGGASGFTDTTGS